MKFSFKIQQYQTDAVDAVARVFQGQPYNAGVSYLRDMGSLSAQPQQLSLVSNGDDATRGCSEATPDRSIGVLRSKSRNR